MPETRVRSSPRPLPVEGHTARLRYHMHDRASSFRFKLAGTLAGDDVVELEQCWNAASSTLAGRAFIVDVSGLNAVDAVGRELLFQWHSQGAEFIATSRQSRLLVESITGVAVPVTLPRRAWYGELLTCRVSPMLLLVLAALIVPMTALSAQPAPPPNLLLTRYTAALVLTNSRLECRGGSVDQAAGITPPSSVDISEANYKFHYVNAIGRGQTRTYIFQITPRRRQVGLVQGELWIDVSSGIAVRMAGQMVKRPSPFQRRVDVVQDTDLRDGRPYRRITRLDIETRPAGRAELTIIEHPRVSPPDGETAAVGLDAELQISSTTFGRNGDEKACSINTSRSTQQLIRPEPSRQ